MADDYWFEHGKAVLALLPEEERHPFFEWIVVQPEWIVGVYEKGHPSEIVAIWNLMKSPFMRPDRIQPWSELELKYA